MSRLLLAVLVLSLLAPGQALAQKKKKRKRPVAKPAPTVIDEASFKDFFFVVAEDAGRSYLGRIEMPDAAILDELVIGLKEPARTKASDGTKRLKEVIDQAECVQRGQNSLPPEIYDLMVAQSADNLEVGSIVEKDFEPGGRLNGSMTADDKALVKACQAEARNEPKDRRSVYQRCLGRKKSALIYPSGPVALGAAQPLPDAACVSLLKEVEVNRPKVPEGTPDELAAKLEETRRRFALSQQTADADDLAVVAAPPLGVARRGRDASYSPISGDPRKLTSDLDMTVPAMDIVDLPKSAQLARTARNNEIGFTGFCYSYVKAAMQAVGIVDYATMDRTGHNEHAYLFAEFAEKHPALMKRKLRRVPGPRWPLPIGTVVIWKPTACVGELKPDGSTFRGYSANSGHIEIVTRINPSQACSDGCGAFMSGCFDKLSAEADSKADLVPALDKAVADAFDAHKRNPSKANTAALKAARKALAEARPVVAYVVEREPVTVAGK